MKKELTGNSEKMRKPKAVFPILISGEIDNITNDFVAEDYNSSGVSSEVNSRNNSQTNLNFMTGTSDNQHNYNNVQNGNQTGTSLESGSPLSLPRKKSVSKSIQNLVNSIRAPNPAQLSQISRFRSGSQSSQPRSRSASLSVINRPRSSSGLVSGNNRNEIESVNPFHPSLTFEKSNGVGGDRSYSPLQSQMDRNNSGSGLNGVIEVDEVRTIDLNPFRTNMSEPNERENGNEESLIITHEDNSAHNTFNPAAYNYNLTNSATIANLRDLADGGDNTPINRTRGNTLRGEEQNEGGVGFVAMNSANNDSIGPSMMNPIRADESGDEQMLDDVIRGEMNGTAHFEPLHEVPEHENEVEMIDADGNRLFTAINGFARQSGIVNSVEDQIETQEEGQVLLEGQSQAESNCNHSESEVDANGFYAIRFTPAIDHSSVHPYMFFGPIIRKLKPEMSLVIGRYTEKSKKAATAPSGSSESVVFKSKVVSRKHAELSVDKNGRWFIQDVGSSSGLFLNHVRLSMPNIVSSKVTLREGDILQFGVDYRGGSEEMYRCVKVKVEVNESWKKRGAKFSEAAHEKLKQLTGMVGGTNSNNVSTDMGARSGEGKGKEPEYTACVICLCDIKPGQPMFVAACSHVWHYRCIRPLLVKTYPQFLCPICKGVCDLEADVDD